MAMLQVMLEHDRRRAGWSAGQAAWRLGVSVREYREIEAGDLVPSSEKWDRICRLRLAADIRCKARSVPPQRPSEVGFAHGWSLDNSSSSRPCRTHWG